MTSGSAFGEEAAAGNRRKLGGIAQHQNRRAEGEQIAADLLVDHGAFVDDDERRLAGGAVVVEHEGGAVLVLAARAVDQAVDGAGAAAALAAHHMGGLAGEGGEGDLAAGVLGDVAGERRLAGAGIAEQAEDLAAAGFQPARDGKESGILLRRPEHPTRCPGTCW